MEMLAIPWMSISIITAIILISALVFLLVINKRKKTSPNYYIFFIMGIFWTPFGIILNNYALFAIGLIFAVLGLRNKNRWKENKKDWKKMSGRERGLTLLIILILIMLIIAEIFAISSIQLGCG